MQTGQLDLYEAHLPLERRILVEDLMYIGFDISCKAEKRQVKSNSNGGLMASSRALSFAIASLPVRIQCR